MSLDTAILNALRTTDWTSGAELSQRLGVTRAAIWARIEDLRRLGYDIEASPHQGYRLLAVPDRLHPDDLVSRLGPTRIVGSQIHVFQETTSSSDVLERLARQGAPDGTVVFAESQTRGRGRLGRQWISPPGQGLWFSVLLRPPLRPQEVTRLTLVAAVALARAIAAEVPLTPAIKWPNDILLHDRKLAGILTELTAESDSVRHVTLGIGINVNQTADAFPPELQTLATSLRLALGRPADRPSLAAAVLRALDTVYAQFLDHRFPALAEEWSSRCSTLGRQISVLTGSRRIVGRAEAIDEEGALLLRTDHGHLERITGGDVTLEK
jgi:BirA family biotin operon repressor/biotin-[acetyl-CoA-carboxylase] ligase